MEKFEIYDSLTYYLTVNLFTLNKKRDTIDLYGYNPDNAAHRWVLDCATLVAPIYDKRIRLQASWWTRFKYWCAHRKAVHYIKPLHDHPEGEQSIDNILTFMLPLGIQISGDQSFSFENINNYLQKEDSNDS